MQNISQRLPTCHRCCGTTHGDGRRNLQQPLQHWVVPTPTTGDGESLWEFHWCSLGRPFLPTSEWNLLQLAHNVSQIASTDAPSRTSDRGCQEHWLLLQAALGSTTDATSVCAPTGRNFQCLTTKLTDLNRGESCRTGHCLPWQLWAGSPRAVWHGESDRTRQPTRRICCELDCGSLETTVQRFSNSASRPTAHHLMNLRTPWCGPATFEGDLGGPLRPLVPLSTHTSLLSDVL